MKDSKIVEPIEAMPDFAKREREMLKYWEEHGIVKKYLRRNVNSKKRFSFIDGPITANNPMGVHHGWGRTYKDLWQRFFNMRGYKQRFQNGFDAQGLWVEVEVEKVLGFTSKKDIETYGVAEFVDKCKQRVRQFSTIQTEQSKRLGYFMDWDHSYFTLSDENNYMIWHFLKVCHQHGWLYKGKESVPWCPRCETAISQHEMLTEDYKEVVHESIFFKLPLVGKDRESLLVWTTTPWTLPANIAVAVDEKLEYALVQSTTGEKLWLAKDAVGRVFGENFKGIISSEKGKSLVGRKYQAPFDDLPAVRKVEGHPKFHTVIATDTRILPVTTDEGTGLVHTAVSAGTEDFRLGKKLGLPMVPVIADNADYLNGLGLLTGKNAKVSPRVILDYLLEEDKKPGVDWVFRIHEYKHRYPSCWRCKTELVWKVTDEWYIAMDKPSRSAKAGKSKQVSIASTLRQRMIEVAKKIHWIPAFGLDRELDWLNNLQDWLISKKNRYWGLCLPIWECHQCGHFEVVGSKKELEKVAVEGWGAFQGKSPHKPQLDQVKIKCSACGEIISRVEPVGNPWLDAGIVPFSTIAHGNRGTPLYTTDRTEWKKWYPADFITESFPGQFKNWFYSLIAMATVLENTHPFKTVLGFATLLGEDSRPMHKSWGNAVEFNEGADSIGVDVMRWMYASQDTKENLLCGYKVAEGVRRRFHLMLWNAFRFVVSSRDAQSFVRKTTLGKPILLDRWILSRLQTTIGVVTQNLLKFDARAATLVLENLVADFSTWYIRRSRERVGQSSANLASKRAFYKTSFEVLTTTAQLIAPFVPFLSEAMYRNLTGNDSVQLSDWPDYNARKIDSKLEANMRLVREIVELGHAQRKLIQIKVRQPLSKLTIKGCKRPFTGELTDLLKDELNVKSVVMVKAGKKLEVNFDTTLTQALVLEGEARELIRSIQEARKKLGTRLDEEVSVTVQRVPKGFTEEIKRKTLANILKEGDTFKVEKYKLPPK